MKVYYASCSQSEFDRLKSNGLLIAGCLYWISDTNHIIRAMSTTEYESYSDQIHIVSNFPTEGIESHLYINPSTGEAKAWHNDSYITIGSSGGNITVDSAIDPNSSNPVQNRILYLALANKANLEHTHTVEDITNFPELSDVATSGSYNDLNDKPEGLTWSYNV